MLMDIYQFINFSNHKVFTFHFINIEGMKKYHEKIINYFKDHQNIILQYELENYPCKIFGYNFIF